MAPSARPRDREEHGWREHGPTTPGEAAASAAAANKARGKLSEPHEDFGYVVPKDVPLAPGAEGRIVAIQAMAGWEKRPKNNIAAGDRREGAAGGFREFDVQAEEARRKRARDFEKMEKDTRKAVKAKCQYCHRASCIC